MVDTKEWFLAAGNKKVGPLTRTRVLERLQDGKVPASTLVWKEGMTDWLPPSDVPELGAAETILTEPKRAKTGNKGSREGSREGSLDSREDSREESREGSREGVARPKKRPSSSGTGALTRSKGAAKRAVVGASAFVPPHRFEKRDMWRAFGLGLERRRVGLAFAGMGLVLLVSLLSNGMAGALGMIHPLIGVPFALAAGLLTSAAVSVVLGALAWQTRRRLEGESVGALEALRFALERPGALAIPPLVLSVAWLAPLLGLAILALLAKIPYLGPIGTGLVYGLHIALGGATLFLVLCAGMGGAFAPVVAAFEETGVKDTLLRLMELVKTSAVRVVLWGALPSVTLVPFGLTVLGLALLALAIPLATTALALGPETFGWVRLGGAGDPPYPGLVAGAIPLALWVVILLGVVVAVIGSVQSALVSLLYVGGRPGNDELPGRP